MTVRIMDGERVAMAADAVSASEEGGRLTVLLAGARAMAASSLLRAYPYTIWVGDDDGEGLYEYRGVFEDYRFSMASTISDGEVTIEVVNNTLVFSVGSAKSLIEDV